ncbi:MerR family regulatory protein [Kytococcus aerolatus]|uniref:MerR family regulatory protein n=1 Tax=Kytococcus aerolatus TaxID=592308 RepID=A0A212T319_9MICO|nr:MerR family transcriptional regulator [Kytococcus aerolatus]SNC60174.1 MerR family regulatory protein [Kytococcus aerolatus]
MSGRHTIGQVVRSLQGEFPDLTISKVRFLEGKGLIAPERTASGYRMFTDAQVDRLRFILEAQRDRFWPLKVISDALDQMDRGLEVDLDAPAPGRPAPPPQGALPPGAPEVVSAADLGAVDPTLRISRAELCRTAEVSPAQVDDMEAFGFVTADKDGWYTAVDVDIARAIGTFAAHGLTARHLRAFRLAADREAALVQQTLTASRPPESEREARKATLAAACLNLHVALVRAELG